MKIYSFLQSLEVEHPEHKFSDEVITQPGLASTPRELLDRVMNGTIDSNITIKGFINDDNDTDVVPDTMGDASDLAIQTDRNNSNVEYLKIRENELHKESVQTDGGQQATPNGNGASNTISSKANEAATNNA